MKKEISRKCERDRNNSPVKDVMNIVREKWSMLTLIMLSDHGTQYQHAQHQSFL